MCRILLPLVFTIKRPRNSNFPLELKTIGDHLRKVRIERGIGQKEVANILNTSNRNVWRWENIGRIPTPPLMSRILTFIDYVPIDEKHDTLGEKLYWTRQIKGLTQVQLSRAIGISEQIVNKIEVHSYLPKNIELRTKIEKFIDQNFYYFNQQSNNS